MSSEVNPLTATIALSDPTVLTTPEVLAELERRRLRSSSDALSRCVNALFYSGELAAGDRRSRTGGNPGNAFTPAQVDLVLAAAELIQLRTFPLGSLKLLRRFARLRGDDEAEVFRSLVRLARALEGLEDEELLGRTA